MAALPDISDEYAKACELDTAILNLLNYYQQAGAKTRAYALVDVLHKRFWDADYHIPGSYFRVLAAWDITYVDTPRERAYRAHVWRDLLRPMLTDAPFMAQLAATKVNKRVDVRVTLEQRDAALTALKEAVVYWDAHFGLK